MTALPVTQADREAAAKLGRMQNRMSRRDVAQVRAGNADRGFDVQAFARHRADHEPRAVEVGLREARRIAADTIGVQGSLRDDYINGVFDNGDHVRIALAAQSPAPMAGEVRPFTEWHEDHGDVLWWKLPVQESPYVGSPLDLGRSMKVVVQIGFEEHDLPITMTGGWPFSEDDEISLYWSRLPDARQITATARPSTQPQADAGSADHSSTREGGK